MLLSVKGRFQDGVARPAEFVKGREGQPVVIIFLEEYPVNSVTREVKDQDVTWSTLAQLVEECAVETGVVDLAHQHDHYLYGKEKRQFVEGIPWERIRYKCNCPKSLVTHLGPNLDRRTIMNGKKAVLISCANSYIQGNMVAILSPPLGLLALGSYLTAHDAPVELIDMQMDFGLGPPPDSERIVSRRVVQYLSSQADTIAWVGISMLSNVSSGVILAEEIHAALPDMPIVFGGYPASTGYQVLLHRYPFITAIVRGDGEAAALEISRCLAQGRSFLSEQTPNLAWLDDGQVRATPVQVMKLEDLPDPDFRLLRNPTCYQLIALMTSRGCSFNCSYCLEDGMRLYSAYSPAWFDRQLTRLEAELPNERMFISDPIFGVGRKRTLELCRVMSKHRFTYLFESRADVLSPDIMPTLRSAGVEAIYLGVESASPATLMRMNKVNSIAQAESYIEKAIEVIKACFASGITPYSGIMLPFPGDSVEDFEASLEFAKTVNQLYTQITAQTGMAGGFSCRPWRARVMNGSPLARQLEAGDFPETVLGPESVIGERPVISPSPAIAPEVVQRYQTEIRNQSCLTPLTMERYGRYAVFMAEDFLAAHADLTDDQGITKFGDCEQRALQ